MHQRIVSLAPSVTEILCSLNCIPIAKTMYCDYPSLDIPIIGSWIHASPHKISNLQPDLMIGSMYVDPKIQAYAATHHIPLLIQHPHTLDDVYASMLQIARLIDKEMVAWQIIKQMKDNLDSLSKSSVRIKVYCEEYHEPPMVAGNWVPDLLNTLGAVSMTKSGLLSPIVSFKEVQKFDPEMIILHWCGYGEASSIEQFCKRWPELRAVKHNLVFTIHDSLLNRPGPRLAQGAQQIHRLLHNYLSK